MHKIELALGRGTPLVEKLLENLCDVGYQVLCLTFNGGEDGVWIGKEKLSVGMSPINTRIEADR